MSFPLEVEFHNIDRSEFIEAAVRKRCARLERFDQEILRCRVVIEVPHKHHAKGNVYQVAIDLQVPGAEILVNRDRSNNHSHEDVYVSIRDAVNAATRQSQDYVRIRRGKVKAHETPGHGKISELHPSQDYGRIETADGRLVYFHRNSVLDANFDDLAIGAEVRFDEETGDEGPQASTVRPFGKHHIVP